MSEPFDDKKLNRIRDIVTNHPLSFDPDLETIQRLIATIDSFPQRIVGVLNRVHEADPSVLPKLIEYRVPCNKDVADDPTVQVGRIEGSDPPLWEVGLLGLLNGIGGIGPTGSGYIGAQYEDDGSISSFKLLSFESATE